MPLGDASGWWTGRVLPGRQERRPQSQATLEGPAAHLPLAKWSRWASQKTAEPVEEVEEVKSSGPVPFWCYATAMRCDWCAGRVTGSRHTPACCPCCPWCAFLLPSMPGNSRQGEAQVVVSPAERAVESPHTSTTGAGRVSAGSSGSLSVFEHFLRACLVQGQTSTFFAYTHSMSRGVHKTA